MSRPDAVITVTDDTARGRLDITIERSYTKRLALAYDDAARLVEKINQHLSPVTTTRVSGS